MQKCTRNMKHRTINSILNSLHSGNKVYISEKMKKGFAIFTIYEYLEVYTQYETQDYHVHI
jgi:hypothetical protein